jgi:hypothetical protein
MTVSEKLGTATVAISGLTLALALSFAGRPKDVDHRKGFVGPGGGTGQSPIMVRGGAMTIRSAYAFGNDDSNNKAICVQMPFNYIELDDIGDSKTGTAVAGVKFAASGGTYGPPASNWQIDLTARTANGAEDSNFSGVRIVSTQTCTITSGPTSPGIDVVLEPLSYSASSQNEQFYRYNAGAVGEDKATYAIRYQNLSLVRNASIGGAAVNYVLAPSPTDGDEDTSEMMYNIYINTSPKSKEEDIQAAPYRWRCKNGQCTIFIGMNS